MRKMRKLFAITLVIFMLAGAFNTGVMAKQVLENGNTWNGDELQVTITPKLTRSNGYSFMSVYVGPHHSYEMSTHMVSVDGANHDIPQLLVMVPVQPDRAYTWTPNGLYSSDSSNYEVLYCCDAETGYDNGVYYKRLNLEDSDYYNEQQAAHIRAIVTNSYPYVSLDEMKATLKANGFEDADKLTRAEIISAVQSAIWAFSNEGADFYYSRSFYYPHNTQWGGHMHDYVAELGYDDWLATGKREFSINEEVGARINALIKHLKNLEPIAAPDNQIVISKLTVTDVVPAETESEIYNVNIDVRLDSSGSDSEKDNIVLNVYVDGVLAENAAQKVVKGTDVYTVNVQAKAGQQIKAVVSGTQYVERGVYFYEPEGGRDVSQCLVGVSEGKTDVYAEETVTIDGFVPKTADLTITKIIDGHMYSPEDSFVFTVRKNNDPSFVMNVVLNEFTKTENKEEYTASVTIKGLPEAVYKVTENTDWSWRYTPEADGNSDTDDAVKVIDLYKENEVTFVNHMRKTNWLTGEDSAENQWPVVVPQPEEPEQGDSPTDDSGTGETVTDTPAQTPETDDPATETPETADQSTQTPETEVPSTDVEQNAD